MSVEEIIARAVGNNPVTAKRILAALDAAGYVVAPKELQPMPYEAFEAWLAEQHRSIGITPALREAYNTYRALIASRPKS